MRALDVIAKKRDGKALTLEEIRFLVSGYVQDSIPEYQVSAWLMAVFLNGMSFEETGYLTKVMIESGSVFDLSTVSGARIDKHSTGGVGDKTSLIIAPIVAACGVKVPMMSGRSLGHTGGTLDKLDSIPGYKTQLDQTAFVNIIKSCGFAMTGQTREIVPADRRMYALRDVTSTVESIPLITASILSKKFAEGADGFVFDVKTGNGAFMKTPERSLELAQSLVNTAKTLNRKAVAYITDMSFPLGTMVGNFLEVEESYFCLIPDTKAWTGDITGTDLRLGGASAGLMELSLELSAGMLLMAGAAATREDAISSCLKVLRNGTALKAFEDNLVLQGGDLTRFKSMLGTERAAEQYTITAAADGFLATVDAYAVGRAGVALGVGRNRTEDKVLPDVGFEMHREQGAPVRRGDPICTVFSKSRTVLQEVSDLVAGAVVISPQPPQTNRLIRQVVHQA